MTKTRFLAAVGIASMAAFAGTANAAPLIVTSYSMPNGDGQAHGGSFNYWDKAYNGSGSTTTDGAALSGGTGDLTDGVVANDYWFNVENGAGTGPYVGWYAGSGVKNPVITFDFGKTVTVTTVQLHIDNSGAGGVFAPETIKFDSVSHAFSGPALGTIGWVTLQGLNAVGSTHSIELDQLHGNTWAFVSEIKFFGSPEGAIPEPATWAMMIAGLGAVGLAMRRRRIAPRVSFA